MSMELISMDHWDIFFSDDAELKRAKREHLEDLIETLQRASTVPTATAHAASPAGDPVRAPHPSVWRRHLVLNGWRLLLTSLLLLAWEVAATTVTTPFWISQPSRVFGRLVSLAPSGSDSCGIHGSRWIVSCAPCSVDG